jgi:hypothetical protein
MMMMINKKFYKLAGFTLAGSNGLFDEELYKSFNTINIIIIIIIYLGSIMYNIYLENIIYK